MKKIFKYTLKIADRQEQELDMQAGEWLDILCVKEQNGKLCLWGIVNPDEPVAKRTFVIYGTGHEMPDDLGDHAYLGTVIMSSGLVWHVFEIC